MYSYSYSPATDEQLWPASILLPWGEMSGIFTTMGGWSRAIVPSAGVAMSAGLVAGTTVARCDSEDGGEHFDAAFEKSFSDTDMSFPDEDTNSAGLDEAAAGRTSSVGVADVFNIDMRGVAMGLHQHSEEAKDSDFLLAAETGQKSQRPWGEKMTFYTGCGLLSGGSVGTLYGAVTGYSTAQGSSTRLIANSVINNAGLYGQRLSNKLGVLALMYSTIG